MSTVLSHIKNNYLKYLFLLVILAVAALAFSVIKSNAINNYVFKRQIGGLITSPTKHEAYIPYSTGIVIDSSNNMYVGSTYSVQKFSPSGSLLLTFGEYGTTTGKLGYVERLATDSSNNIYVTSNNYDSNAEHSLPIVSKFDSSGNFISEFGSYGVDGTGDGNFQYADSVAINPVNNYIYVSDYYRNDIQVFDTNGNYVEKFGSSGTGDGQFSGPYGITFDKNNDIYVADSGNSRVQKFASTTHTFLSQFGTPGSGDGQFNLPINIVIDSHGDLFVSDSGNSRVQKFSSSTNTFMSKFGTPGSSDGQFSNPYGDIAIDSGNNIYVGDSYNSRVQKFDSVGTFLEMYTSSGSGNGEFNWPIGIGLDSQGNIYVGDDVNQRIQKFDNNGNFLLKFGTPGSGDGQFLNTNSINALVVDADDNIYVSDVGVGRIQKFDSNGNFLFKISTVGQDALAIDPATKNIYSVENGTNKQVSVYSATGTPLFTFGSVGTGNGQFTKPMGITITPAGYVYVGDNAYPNSRIQKFDLSGNYISQFGTDGIEDGQFSPYTFLFYIASDSGNNIYVADYYNNRVQKFDSNGNFLSKFSTADKLPNPMGIALDSSNNVYLTNLYGNRVVVYGPSPLVISDTTSTTTATSSTISWTSSAPGSSIVEYGPSSSFGTSTVEGDTSPRVTNHSVTINNLPSCTTFAYRVKSINDSAVTTTDTNHSFTTLGCTNMTTVQSSASVAASSTATSTVSNSAIQLDIPPSVLATTTPIVFQANKIEPVTFFAGVSVPSGKISVSNEVFHLVAVTADNNITVSTFDKPVQVSISYSPSDLNGIDPSTLSIYRYDGSSWYPLTNCSTNTNTNTVSCYTTHFSDFALFATPVSTTNTVTVSSGGGMILPINARTENTINTTQSNPIQQIIINTTNSINSTTTKLSRTLRRGMSGSDVLFLQRLLSNIPGIYPEQKVTGYFGNLTYKAVQRYQCKYNIVCQGTPEGTGWGTVGAKTRASIR